MPSGFFLKWLIEMDQDRLKFTILGCGSSPGVPRPNGDWGDCDPNNPKNYRSRSSMLVEKISDDGKKTTVIIDTGPDFRAQMLMAKVKHIDGVVYTHGHADHIHGIDDLRSFVMSQHELIAIYADKHTLKRLNEGFGYCFKTPEGSSYPPILEEREIIPYQSFQIFGEGGAIEFLPLTQIHGDICSLAFRIGSVAYCTDVNQFPNATSGRLENLDVLIIDALQYRPHPSHFCVAEALEWIKVLRPRRAILTHMHVRLDYKSLIGALPENVEPAFNGLTFELAIGRL